MNNLSKFVKDYSPPTGSFAPQGKSTESYVSDKKNEFLTFLSKNLREDLEKDAKKEARKYKKGKSVKADMGLEVPEWDSSGTNAYNPDQFWVNNPNGLVGSNTISAPNAPDFGSKNTGFDSNLLKGIPQTKDPSIQLKPSTGGYQDAGNGPFGPYSDKTNEVPKSVMDMKNKGPETPAGAGSKSPDLKPGADALGKGAGGLKALGLIEPSMFFDALSEGYKQDEEARKKKWLDRQMAIENVVPVNYGSRGDYDINSGRFRPDRYGAKMKKGGSKEDPKAFWGALISLIPMVMGQMQKNKEAQDAKTQQLEAENVQRDDLEKQSRMNILTGAQQFQPSYKKGGSYTVNSEQLQHLINQGYEFDIE